MNSTTIKKDLLASAVVFLISVPLSLGIALASGAPMISALIAAAVGGIVAGALGGSPLQVSGPSPAMPVIVFGMVQSMGWQTACVATILAGAIQIILGKSKVARAALAISPAVMYGMLAGIGITITVGQVQAMLGGTPASSVIKNIARFPHHLTNVNIESLILGFMAVVILVVWAKLPKKIQTVPGALVAVGVPTLLSVVAGFDVKRIDLPHDVLSGIVLPVIPKMDLWQQLITAALMIAMVSSVESLLSAAATDKLHTGERANLDKELVGQGIANMVSGALGGYPINGVIVRSSANINAGAQTRLSTIIHGVWIIIFALFFGDLLRMIPLAVLAGLLVYVGAKLINFENIRTLTRHKELPVYIPTVVGVACVDLITGVAIGLGLSLFFTLRRLANAEVQITYGQGTTKVHVNGSLTFLNVPRLMQMLNTIPPGEKVELEIHTDFMDHAAFDAVHGWERSYLNSGGVVSIEEPHEEWYEPASNNEPRFRKSRILSQKATVRRDDPVLL